MVILYCGGEDIDGVGWGGAAPATSNTSYRRSTYARCHALVPASTAYWMINHTSSTEYYVSFRKYSNSTTTSVRELATFGNSDFTEKIVIRNSSSSGMSLDVWDGSAYVTLGTVSAISASSLLKFVIYIKHGASGAVKIWIDDNLVINYSGNLSSYITGGFTHLKLKSMAGSGGVSAFSEILVSDSDISTYSVSALTPTSDSSNTDFTGGYGEIDEVVLDDADYIYTSTSGHKSDFVLSDLPEGEEYVHAISCATRAVRGETGPQRFRFYVVLDGTNYYSSYMEPTAVWTTYKYMWARRPDNNAYWSRDDANALVIGIESSD